MTLICEIECHQTVFFKGIFHSKILSNAHISHWRRFRGRNGQIQDIEFWGNQPHFISNFKPAAFVHVTFLELLYPTSAFCYKIDNEIDNYYTEINFVFRKEQRRQMMILNGFKNAGNILLALASFDMCFEGWGGSCPGRVLGQAAYSLLDPSAAEIYANLNLHSLHGRHGTT